MNASVPFSTSFSSLWRHGVVYVVLASYIVHLQLATAGGVVAASNAPVGHKPIVDAAANGVGVVHIAPPSAAGVSSNFYEQFNVDSRGLILNNATQNVPTQLGGWVTPNLQ